MSQTKNKEFISEIFNQYEIIRGKPIDKKVIIFIDEVQALDNWPLWLKRYYDQDKIKFIITGSNADLIKNKRTELTGRSINLEIYPFNFKEICQYKLGINSPAIKRFNFSNWLKLKTSLSSKAKKIKILFEKYIEHGGYPEVVNQKSAEKRKVILTNYYNQILYRDIVRNYKIKQTMILENLSLYLMQNIAQKFSFRNIAKILETNTETVRIFINYLKLSYLFQVINFFGTSLKTVLKKDKKFYCLDNGFRNAIVGHKGLDKGFLVENLVLQHLQQRFAKVSFWYNQKKQELDFIAKDNGFIMPIEVKYSDAKLKLKKFNGLIDFLEQKNQKTGYILTQDKLEEKIVNKKKIIFIPTWLFCLGIN